MKLVTPKFEILEQPSGFEGIYKMIEKAGRTCYKSEGNIKEGSAMAFVERMLSSGHLAMLEHGTLYLKVPNNHPKKQLWYGFLHDNPYTKNNNTTTDGYWYITTNYRVIAENNGLADIIECLCEPTENHVKRVSVKFTLSRQIANEFVRHRVFSFAQESTRYCNYSKSKFNSELTFIKPCWFDDNKINVYGEIGTPEALFIEAMNKAESTYMAMLNKGWKPQQAAVVLPNALKTELIMTGFIGDWLHFFKLRSDLATTGNPHPQAKELANPLMAEFINRGLLNH